HAQELLTALTHGRRVEPPERPVEGEELVPGEAVEERRGVLDDADPGLGRDRILPHVRACDLHAARVGAQETRRHGEQRRLPGAVGPDEAEERAVRYVEVDAGHRDLVPEAAREPAQPYGRARPDRRYLRARHAPRIRVRLPPANW